MRAPAICALSLVLSACAHGIVTHNEGTHKSPLFGSCYQIKKPAFLYEARCADMKASGFGSSTFCTGLQGFDPLPYTGRYSSQPFHYDYPKSWEEYLTDRSGWDKKMFERLLFEKQRTIIGPVELGTQLRVSSVVEYPRGETGRVMVVRATVLNGKFGGTEVELHSSGGFSDTGPHWTQEFYSWPKKDGGELTTEYLRPCENQSSNKALQATSLASLRSAPAAPERQR